MGVDPILKRLHRLHEYCTAGHVSARKTRRHNAFFATGSLFRDLYTGGLDVDNIIVTCVPSSITFHASSRVSLSIPDALIDLCVLRLPLNRFMISVPIEARPYNAIFQLSSYDHDLNSAHS